MVYTMPESVPEYYGVAKTLMVFESDLRPI